MLGNMSGIVQTVNDIYCVRNAKMAFGGRSQGLSGGLMVCWQWRR